MKELVAPDDFNYVGTTHLREMIARDVNVKFRQSKNKIEFSSAKFRPISEPQFGDVVQITSSDWYVWTKVDRPDQVGYWREMTTEEQLEYSK